MSTILASSTHRVPHAAAFGTGGIPTIAFINQAKTPLGYNLDTMIAGLQTALDDHFSPVWGAPAKLARFDNEADAPDGAWRFYFKDTADVQGALGYHDLQLKLGVPVTFVFVKTTLDDGGDVAVTASHELWEMLIDPGVQMWAEGPKGTLWAYETADAVEETDFEVDGVRISNFVYPSFFEYFHRPNSTRFDHLGLVDRPFRLLKGGYTLVRKGASVKQVFGSAAKAKRFAEEDRRFHRSQLRTENLRKLKTRALAGVAG